MRRFAFLLCSTMAAAALLASAQGGVDQAKLLHPPTHSWPAYNGDHSGRRLSTLAKVNASNVNALTLAWASRVSVGTGGAGAPAIKSTPIQVNGVLYVTTPDNVWAIDARAGREIWHYIWKSSGGNHLANRGAA